MICKCSKGFSLSNSSKLVLLLDYYDGPVSGIITCQYCNTHYAFAMLDWTSDHQHRMFMLHAIGDADYERFEDAYYASSMGSINQRHLAYDFLKKVIEVKTKPDELVIWDNLNEVMIATIPVPITKADDIWIPWFDNSANLDWFTLLEIPLSIILPRKAEGNSD